jgi:DNA-binding response OmpR family regulator
VEDDSALRGTLAVCLRIAGFHVATAPDEDSALRQFEQNRPSAVISDLVLPDGDGMNIVRRMRAAAPEAPIVVISGGGMFPASHLLGVAKSLGANAALSKPFKPAALVDVLRDLVQAA